VLKRLYRELDDNDKSRYKDCFSAYIDKSSGQYIYRIEKTNINKELSSLGRNFQTLYQGLASKYSNNHVFKIFLRVYQEQFISTLGSIEPYASNELHSGIVMSPDDLEATYRKKERQKSKGYVGHLSETANQENKLQLITDIILEPNNIGDAELLEKRLPEMLKKTPDLKEYFADGLYGSPAVDKIMNPNNIKLYQSGVRGRVSFGKLRIHKKKDKTLWVKCGGNQDVQAIKRSGWCAKFDYSICTKCPLAEKCNTKKLGLKKENPNRVWYFGEKQIMAHLRINNFDTLPDYKKTLRANVEATVKQLQFGMNNRKVRVRSRLRILAYLTLTTIATNLKRIHAYLGSLETPHINWIYNIILAEIRFKTI
jgi:hypothetical protein